MNPIDLIGTDQTLLRLSAATLVGAAFGLNRDLHGKPAGVRTHALVALGAALVTMSALEPHGGSIGPDPNAIGRIVQGILTGIGFLGAGVILRDPVGKVSGLTTAATIWVCAAMGISCGLGYWRMIGLALGLAFVVLLLGKWVERIGERLFKPKKKPPLVG
ncbi:MAG: MgtC/SapB family protein [Acidobacteriota bacterium]